MTELLPTITRPNGSLYRPQKLRCELWRGEPGQGMGVVVLGTHDVDQARQIATREIQREYDPSHVATVPYVGWWRLAIRRGEHHWIDDPVRGAAGVMFTADELEPGDTDD